MSEYIRAATAALVTLAVGFGTALFLFLAFPSIPTVIVTFLSVATATVTAHRMRVI